MIPATRYTYPPTRWQMMAETGETVDETFDAYQAFYRMWRTLGGEWTRLRKDHADCVIQFVSLDGVRRSVDLANDARFVAIDAIVAMVDARRHAAKVVNLSGAERDRALELLAIHDTTPKARRDHHHSGVFKDAHPSGVAPQLRLMLAADEDARRAVTDMLIEVDTAVRTALEAVEDVLRAIGRHECDHYYWEPERDTVARGAKAAAERAELEALGITLGTVGATKTSV